MAGLKQFAKRARKLGDNVAENSDALIRRVAVAVDTAVVLATPVDTGRARSNWQAEIDGPAVGTVDTLALGDPGTGAAVAQRSIQTAKLVIDTYDGDKDRAIHITNNLAYIGRLNEGYSAQAPADYVAAAVQAGADAVKGASILVDRGTRT